MFSAFSFWWSIHFPSGVILWNVNGQSFFCRRDGKISKKRKCNVILGTKFYFECKLSLCYVTCLRFLPVNVRKWKSNSMKCVPVCMFVCVFIFVVYHKYLPLERLMATTKLWFMLWLQLEWANIMKSFVSHSSSFIQWWK